MTFREFLLGKRGTLTDTLLQPVRPRGYFEPTVKRPGDLVLTSRGVEVVA